MKKYFKVLSFLLYSSISNAEPTVKDLAFWNLDLSRAQCLNANGQSRVFFDGTQDKWIRSEQLTRLMKISAKTADYRIEIAGAVYVNARGNMVFLGYQDFGANRRILMLNTFAFGVFRKSKGDELDLLAQHAVSVDVESEKILWPDGGDECVFSQ